MGKPTVPFLDADSQSNVVVKVSDLFGGGVVCPPRYTNALSNTNLFMSHEQRLIMDVFKRYKNVTTNSGPAGTVLVGFYKTNYVIKAMNRVVKIEHSISDFRYTNVDATEEVQFGGGMLAKFRNRDDNGYNASFIRTADGTLLSFREYKNGLPNGLAARFLNEHGQGSQFNLEDFEDSHLEEYRRYTNGMILGTYLMWNPLNGKLLLDADFQAPYDFEKYRRDSNMSGMQLH